MQMGSTSGPVAANGEPLCVLTIHAHPDDESSKGAGTIARYRDEGIRTVLVCCTGGELGDIANPAMDKPGVKDNLAEIRRDELAAATKIIGFDEVIMLGYRDSGMAGDAGNDDPASFHQAEIDDCARRLVKVIRQLRPQVVITYGDNQQGYPHPDHLKVHAVSGPAFERAGDPAWYPELGPLWQPQKLYYSLWARERTFQMHHKFVELGLKSPYDEKWLDRPWEDHRITTRVSVDGYYDVRVNALLAHATQIDPTSPWWFGLPPEVAKDVHPFDDYVLARSLVPGQPGESERSLLEPGSPPPIFEDDLFAGLRH